MSSFDTRNAQNKKAHPFTDGPVKAKLYKEGRSAP